MHQQNELGVRERKESEQSTETRGVKFDLDVLGLRARTQTRLAVVRLRTHPGEVMRNKKPRQPKLEEDENNIRT